MKSYVDMFSSALHKALIGVQVTNKQGKKFDKENALDLLCNLSKGCKNNNSTQFFCGNGASAAFASHMAVDWSKNGGVRSMAFNDPALLTALGNDVSGEAVFARSLQMYALDQDMLITISSSGNSPNIIKAIEQARKLDMSVVTISGLRPDNKSRKMGDINLYISANTYGIVESAHQVLLHAWIDRFLGLEEWNASGPQDMREYSQ